MSAPAPIGHNNPPPHELIGLHVDDLLTTVSDTLEGAEVTTDEQEEALAGLLDEARKAAKDADAKRKDEKQPHLDAGREVDANYNPIIKKAKAAADEIKAKLTPYRVAKQAARDAEAKRIREEAEAKELAAQEALKSDNLEQRVEAEQQLETAQKMRVVANKADRAPTGIRTRQVATVTDYKALLLHIAHTDKQALDAWLDGYAQRALPSQLPGVRIDTESKAA